MKRLLLAITALCLLAAPCYAGPPHTMMMMANSWGGGNSQVVYSGTIASLRISSVDGTAFLDNCAALVPYADGSHLVEIYDASGRMLRGYLSAAGTGETFTEVYSNGAWTGASGATPPTGLTAGGAGTFSIFDSGDGSPYDTSLKIAHNGTDHLPYIQRNNTVVIGKLYNYSVAFKHGDGTKGVIYLSTSQGGGGTSYLFKEVTNAAWTTYSYNKTAVATSMYTVLQAYTLTPGKYELFDTLLLRSIDTPSSSGATIVSAKGGATQNFSVKDSSFTYNSSAYYCVVRKAR